MKDSEYLNGYKKGLKDRLKKETKANKNCFKALLIKRKESTKDLLFQKIEINRKKSLKDYYKYLKCEKIDIQERIINNKIYDFIFDEEYMINGKSEKSENAVAIGIYQNKPIEIIFDALIICGNANEKGEETSLKEEDITNIINSIKLIYNTKLKDCFQLINYFFEIK